MKSHGKKGYQKVAFFWFQHRLSRLGIYKGEQAIICLDIKTLKITHFPNNLLDVNQSNVHVYDYHVNEESIKQQIDLSMNTFSFLLDGYKEVYTDVKSSAISNQKFLLMKSGKCLMTEKFSVSEKSYRSILFFFTDDAVVNFTRKHSIEISSTAKRKPVQSLRYDNYLRSFVNSLIEIIQLSESQKFKVLKVKLEELLLYLIETNGDGFLQSLLIGTNIYERHFHEVIESNILNKLSITELAFLCNMSASSFKRKFEIQYEASPGKWFQERRLEHSARLLKIEGKRPTDIYAEVGYESLSNFIQAFKLQYGLTPKQYQSKLSF